MLSIDAIYTPAEVASDVAAALDPNGSSVVLDPAMGAGALLAAVDAVAPASRLYGLDVDPEIVAHVATTQHRWVVDCCDFLVPESLASTGFMASGHSEVTGVVLNPPFSCRGGRTVTVPVHEREDPTKCSVAMAFVLTAVGLLGPGGVVAALLPLGALTSAKDEHARWVLGEMGSLETLCRYDRNTFADRFASTALVRYVKREAGPAAKSRSVRGLQSAGAPQQLSSPVDVGVTRGWVQMHTRGTRKGPFRWLIHTTDLRGLGTRQLRKVRSTRACAGPMVLLPRVGNVSQEQVVVVRRHEYGGAVALSDCIFGIKCVDDAAAEALRACFLDNWSDLRSLYGGSCAEYLRRQQLSEYVASLLDRGVLMASEVGSDVA